MPYTRDNCPRKLPDETIEEWIERLGDDYPPCEVRVGSIVTTDYDEKHRFVQREITAVYKVPTCPSGWFAQASGGKGGYKINGTAYMGTPARGICTDWFTVIKY